MSLLLLFGTAAPLEPVPPGVVEWGGDIAALLDSTATVTVLDAAGSAVPVEPAGAVAALVD